MTTAADLLRAARADGVELLPNNDKLRIRGAADAVERWRPTLATHKAALLALLRGEPEPPAADPEALREAFEERAAILEYDANLSREEAEAKARQMVYGAGPTPAQRAEAEQLAELARRPRGEGGLAWRDHDVAEFLDDHLRRQPAWALAALAECLAFEAAALAGHPDAAALYGYLMLGASRSAPLAECGEAPLRALARAGLVRIEGERATALVPELATLSRRRAADARPRTHQR